MSIPSSVILSMAGVMGEIAPPQLEDSILSIGYIPSEALLVSLSVLPSAGKVGDAEVCLLRFPWIFFKRTGIDVGFDCPYCFLCKYTAVGWHDVSTVAGFLAIERDGFEILI